MTDAQRRPRAVATGRGTAWISEGFELFKEAPGVWIGICVLWAVILAALSLIPLGSLAYTLVGPVFAGGIIIGCRDLAGAKPLKLEHLFRCFGDGHFGPLVLVGLFSLVAELLIAVVVMILGFASMAGAVAAGGLDTANIDPGAMAVAILIGLLFAVPLAMALWFAPALVVLDDQAPMAALKQSFSGCWRNMMPFTIYGLLALLLLIVAMIPLGLGLLVVGPLLMASVYAGYRDIFDAAAGSEQATQQALEE